MRSVLFLIGFGLMTAVVKAEFVLPQPLSLQDALAISLRHPVVMQADMQRDKVAAQQSLLASENDLNVDFQGQLNYVDPAPLTPDRSHNDSKVFLRFSSELYDFGYTDARQQALEKQLNSASLAFMNTRQQHQLKVAELFFEVLIADKEYVLIDEIMTAAFLDYDKLLERHDLGTVSDVDLLRLENDYREKLQLRRLAEKRQRMSRMQLASAMGVPEHLPADLLEPEVNWKSTIPAIDQVMETALARHPQILAATEAVEAARAQLAATESSDNPTLSARMQFADYQRQTGTSHPFEMGLTLNLPLYSGGQMQAQQQQARVALHKQELALQTAKIQAREAVLQTLLDLEEFKTELDTLKVSEDYAELYLDQNRALYELEVASDLKDALIKVSDVILKKIKARLGYALAEMKLAAMQGQWPLEEQTRTENTNEKTQ